MRDFQSEFENDRDHDSIPRAALALGWSGVIPFALLSTLTFVGVSDWNGTQGPFLVAYGAVILSFMGGIHWGLARAVPSTMSVNRQTAMLIVSVLPALTGWVATMFPISCALIVLSVSFLALLAFDLWSVREGGAPSWYARLRRHLTTAVVFCLVATALVA